MLEQLVGWLREEQRKIQEGVFDSPPRDWVQFKEKCAEYRAFEDVLKRIDQLQEEEDDRDNRK